jgi:hypothetical protein
MWSHFHDHAVLLQLFLQSGRRRVGLYLPGQTGIESDPDVKINVPSVGIRPRQFTITAFRSGCLVIVKIADDSKLLPLTQPIELVLEARVVVALSQPTRCAGVKVIDSRQVQECNSSVSR